jgi:hypothetical protein
MYAVFGIQWIKSIQNNGVIRVEKMLKNDGREALFFGHL